MLFNGFCDIDVFILKVYLFFHVLFVLVLATNLKRLLVLSKIISKSYLIRLSSTVPVIF